MNAKLDELRPVWARVAAALALNALGGAGEAVESLTVEYTDLSGRPAAESPQRARIVVITSPLDDSVSRVRYTFWLVTALAEDGGSRWRYESLTAEYACRAGRGQTDFAPRLCQ